MTFLTCSTLLNADQRKDVMSGQRTDLQIFRVKTGDVQAALPFMPIQTPSSHPTATSSRRSRVPGETEGMVSVSARPRVSRLASSLKGTEHVT